MKSKDTELEKHLQEFDPYLSAVIMDKLNKRTDEKVLLDKSDLVDFLSRQCRENNEFAHALRTVLFDIFDLKRVNDPIVMRRIRDINLLYRLKFYFKPPLKIESKVAGRALEFVVESVLKSKLNSSRRFGYEFVDWQAIDYMILDKDRNDWIAGIQCKMSFVGGFLSYQREIKKLKEFVKNIRTEKTLVMFCGLTYKSKKEEVKNAFEKEGWKFYYLWKDINSFKIDESFYEFIDMIERIVIDQEK